jgi:hypothetical protein
VSHFGPVLDHGTFYYPPITTLKYGKQVLPKFERLDWRIVNCEKSKNGSENVTYCYGMWSNYSIIFKPFKDHLAQSAKEKGLVREHIR